MTVRVHRYQNGVWDDGQLVQFPGNITEEDINGLAVRNSIAYALAETFNPQVGNQWVILKQTSATAYTVFTTCPNYIIQPRGLTVCNNEDLYIVERSRGKIFKFTVSTGTWDPNGIDLPSAVTDPEGMTIDLFGTGYVVDDTVKQYFRYTTGVWQPGISFPSRIQAGGIAVDRQYRVHIQDIRTGQINTAEAGEDVWAAGTDVIASSRVKGLAVDINPACIDDGQLGISLNVDCTSDFSGADVGSLGGSGGAELTVGTPGFISSILDSFDRFIDNLGNIWEKIKGIWTNVGSLGDIFRALGATFDTILDFVFDWENLPWLLAIAGGLYWLFGRDKDGNLVMKQVTAMATNPKSMAIGPNGDQYVLDAGSKKIYKCSNDSWDNGTPFPTDTMFPTGLTKNLTVSFYGSTDLARWNNNRWNTSSLPIVSGITDRGPQGIERAGNITYVINGPPGRTNIYRFRGSNLLSTIRLPSDVNHATGVSFAGGDIYALGRDSRQISRYDNGAWEPFLRLDKSIIYPVGLNVTGTSSSPVIEVLDNHSYAVWRASGNPITWRVQQLLSSSILNPQGLANVGGSYWTVDGFSGSIWNGGTQVARFPEVAVTVCGLAIGPDNSILTLDPSMGRVWRLFNNIWTVAVQLPSTVTDPTEISVAPDGSIVITSAQGEFVYTGAQWNEIGLPPGVRNVFPIATPFQPIEIELNEESEINSTESFEVENGELPTPLEIGLAISSPITSSETYSLEDLSVEELERVGRVEAGEVPYVREAWYSVRFRFPDTEDPGRVTTWPEDTSILSEDFENTGSVIDVVVPEHNLDIIAREATITMTLFQQGTIGILYARDFRGTQVDIYFSTRDTTGVTNSLEFTGTWDHHSLSPSNNGYTLQIKVSSALNTLRIVDANRYTDAQQKHKYPGDEFFSFLNEQVGERLT